MKLYSAKSPEDIAAHFDRMAEKEIDGRRPFKTIRGAAIAKASASVWREAAAMIRNTEFVGWEPGK